MNPALDMLAQLDEAAARHASEDELDGLFEELVGAYRAASERDREKLRRAYGERKHWGTYKFHRTIPWYGERFKTGGAEDDLRRALAMISLEDWHPDPRDVMSTLTWLETVAAAWELDPGLAFREAAALSNPQGLAKWGSLRDVLQNMAHRSAKNFAARRKEVLDLKKRFGRREEWIEYFITWDPVALWKMLIDRLEQEEILSSSEASRFRSFKGAGRMHEDSIAALEELCRQLETKEAELTQHAFELLRLYGQRWRSRAVWKELRKRLKRSK
jgi:hypothetical protein